MPDTCLAGGSVGPVGMRRAERKDLFHFPASELAGYCHLSLAGTGAKMRKLFRVSHPYVLEYTLRFHDRKFSIYP